MSSDTYWRDKLSPEYAKAYDDLVSNISRGKPFVNFYVHDGRDLQKLYHAVIADNPQFFWLDPVKIRCMQTMRGLSVSFGELYNKRDISAAQRSCDAAAAAVRGATQLETEKNIADYIVRNVTYAVDNSLNQNMAAALHFKKAQCSGIARAVKYLCDKNGIWCIEVGGTAFDNGTSGPHAWNIVCLDGKYYHLDVTSMLGANIDKPQNLRYLYFNWSDGEIEKSHTWNRADVPECRDEFQDENNILGESDAQQSAFGSAGNVRPQPSSAGANNYQSSSAGANNYQPNRTANNATNRTNVNKAANVPVYSSMAELRGQIEKAGQQKRDKIEFNLNVGGAPEAQVKLIESSVNMVSRKIMVFSQFQIQYDGTKFIVAFSYRS